MYLKCVEIVNGKLFVSLWSLFFEEIRLAKAVARFTLQSWKCHMSKEQQLNVQIVFGDLG